MSPVAPDRPRASRSGRLSGPREDPTGLAPLIERIGEWVDATRCFPELERDRDSIEALLRQIRERQASLETPLAPHVDRIFRFAVTDFDAASMFSLNLPTLRQTEEARRILDDDALDLLQGELDDISVTFPTSHSIEWGLRQIAFKME